MIPLSHTQPGKNYNIAWINMKDADNSFKRYGIMEGASVLTVANTYGDILVKLKGKTIALSEQAAFRIKVTEGL